MNGRLWGLGGREKRDSVFLRVDPDRNELKNNNQEAAAIFEHIL